MRRAILSKVVAAAGLAVLAAMVAAPVAVCAGMPDCPMAAKVATGCHGGSAAVGPTCHNCPAASRLAARDCCAAAERTPVAAVEGRRVVAPVQVSSLPVEEVRLAAAPAPATPRPYLDTGPAPSGRDRLSLLQSFLI